MKRPTQKRNTTTKKPRGKKRRTPRKLLIFSVLFLIVFLIAGGWKIILPRTWQSIGDFLPRLPHEAPANMQQNPHDPTWQERATRLIFIRRAVKQRMNREDYVPLAAIPKDLQNAVISVEDRRFHEHFGFDLTGMARAGLVNLQSGQIEEGASTITQQLVKNLFLTNEQSMGRKAEELLLALSIEANYSKDEILELYLNTIYYGSNFYGIKAAANGYFDKAPQHLTLAESAMLAGLPNAPSLYSPYVDFILAKKRQIIVLETMQQNGYILTEEQKDAEIEPLYLARKS